MTDKEKRLRGIEGVARIRKQIVVAQLCKVSQKWVEFVRSPREHGYGRDEWGLPIYYNIRFRVGRMHKAENYDLALHWSEGSAHLVNV